MGTLLRAFLIDSAVRGLRAWLTDPRQKFDPELSFQIHQATFGASADKIDAKKRLSIVLRYWPTPWQSLRPRRRGGHTGCAPEELLDLTRSVLHAMIRLDRRHQAQQEDCISSKPPPSLPPGPYSH